MSLTANAEVKTLTAGNDTVDGGTALNSLAGDTIVDGSTTDSDILNAVYDATVATPGVSTISNVETVNVTAKFGTVTFDASKVAGGTVVTSHQLGGSVVLTGVDGSANTAVKAGTGVTQLSVTAQKGAVIDAGAATTVLIDGVADTTANDTATIKLNGTAGDVTINNVSGNELSVLTLNSTTAANSVILSTSVVGGTNGVGAAGSGLTVTGNQNLTIKAAADTLTSTVLGLGVTNSLTNNAKLTVGINAVGASVDLTKVNANTFDVLAATTNTTARVVSLASGANVKVSNVGTDNAVLALSVPSATATTNVLNLEVAETQTGTARGITVSNAKTINLSANTKAVDLMTVTATGATINLSGNKDITFGAASAATAITAAAGAYTGKLNATANSNLTKITGGDGDDTIVAYAGAMTLDGGAGNDVLQVAANTDLSGSAISFTGIEQIQITSAHATNAKFAASQLTGKTLSLFGSDDIDVVQVDATSMNLAGLTGDPAKTANISLGTGVQGLSQTIVGASGLKNVIHANTLTGTNKADITGGTLADVIVGSTNADTITGGNGADVIVGGRGADRIILTETTPATDIVRFFSDGTTTTDGLTAADVATAAQNGIDTIVGFAAGSATTADKLSFMDTGADINGTSTLVFAKGTAAQLAAGTATANGGTDIASNANVIIVTDAVSTLTGAGIQSLITTINAGAGTDIGNGVILVVAGATGDAQIYYDAAAASDDAVQIGVLEGITLTGLSSFVAGNFEITAGA